MKKFIRNKYIACFTLFVFIAVLGLVLLPKQSVEATTDEVFIYIDKSDFKLTVLYGNPNDPTNPKEIVYGPIKTAGPKLEWKDLQDKLMATGTFTINKRLNQLNNEPFYRPWSMSDPTFGQIPMCYPLQFTGTPITGINIHSYCKDKGFNPAVTSEYTHGCWAVSFEDSQRLYEDYSHDGMKVILSYTQLDYTSIEKQGKNQPTGNVKYKDKTHIPHTLGLPKYPTKKNDQNHYPTPSKPVATPTPPTAGNGVPRRVNPDPTYPIVNKLPPQVHPTNPTMVDPGINFRCRIYNKDIQYHTVTSNSNTFNKIIQKYYSDVYQLRYGNSGRDNWRYGIAYDQIKAKIVANNDITRGGEPQLWDNWVICIPKYAAIPAITY